MHTSALALSLPTAQKALGEPYLKFQLEGQLQAVFPMRHVQEVLTLPARRLAPMPNMPMPMLGLMNRRSRVLWVVDLAQILGLGSLDLNVQQYTLVLLQVGTVSVALAVQQVEGITRLQSEAIQPIAGQIPAPMLPYVRGCLLQQQEHTQEMLLVLDAEAVLQSPILCQK